MIEAFGGANSTRGNTGPFWVGSGLAVFSAIITFFMVKPLDHNSMIEEDRLVNTFNRHDIHSAVANRHIFSSVSTLRTMATTFLSWVSKARYLPSPLTTSPRRSTPGRRSPVLKHSRDYSHKFLFPCTAVQPCSPRNAAHGWDVYIFKIATICSIVIFNPRSLRL